MTAVYRPGLPASAPARIRRLHILPLLPDQFSNYLRFASRDEFVLCFTAWLHVATCVQGTFGREMDTQRGVMMKRRTVFVAAIIADAP